MIDYSLYGLSSSDVTEYNEAVHRLLGQSVIELLDTQQALSKDTLLAYLIKEIEQQPDEYLGKYIERPLKS